MLVILAQQGDSQHEVVDVIEHECMFVGVLRLLREEGDGVVAPVAERVEVMRGVVAVVVAVAVTLKGRQYLCNVKRLFMWVMLTGASISVMLDLKSESGSTSSTKACCPQLPVIRAIRISASGIKKTKMAAFGLTNLYMLYKKT